MIGVQLRKLPYAIDRDFFQKIENFIEKKTNKHALYIFAQNTHCEYKLEPPRRVPTMYVLDRKFRKGTPQQTPVFL